MKIDNKTARSMPLPFTSYDSERREIVRLVSEFNLAAAIRQRAAKRPLEGVEAELHELLQTRAQVPTHGNIVVPSAVFRAGTAGAFETTGTGSAFMPTAVPPARLSARQRPLLDALGVRTVASDGANIQLPTYSAGAMAVKGEAAAADSSAAAAGEVNLTAKRATSYTLVTQQLLVQGGSESVISSLVAELQADIARLVDRTAFDLLVNSTSGITTNVEEATAGATARPLTQDMLDDMLRAAFTSGGDMRNMRYVASPAGLEDIQGIQTNGMYALDRVSEVVNSKPFYATNDLVDHTDGTARVIVGDWEQGLVKCDFGLLDIQVNPYSYDTSGQVQIVLNQYFDVQILDESVFSIYREEV